MSGDAEEWMAQYPHQRPMAKHKREEKRNNQKERELPNHFPARCNEAPEYRITNEPCYDRYNQINNHV
jgi:hypothetical protein